jgi:hypothetical protein
MKNIGLHSQKVLAACYESAQAGRGSKVEISYEQR